MPHPGKGGYGPQLGELPEVLGGGGEQELVAGAAGAAQPQPIELQDALEVGEQHLDLLALVARALEGRRVGQSAGDVARVLVGRAGSCGAVCWDSSAPSGHRLAVALAGAVEPDAVLVDARCGASRSVRRYCISGLPSGQM